jgi:hypothetical protein
MMMATSGIGPVLGHLCFIAHLFYHVYNSTFRVMIIGNIVW